MNLFMFAAQGLSSRLQIVAIIVTLGLLFTVLELIRRRRLMERYSLLWLLTAVVLLAMAVFNGLLGKVAQAVGIATPSNALFAAAVAFLAMLVLHFSTTISRLTDESKVLAQRLALTEERLRRAEDAAAGEPDEVQTGQQKITQQ